MYWYITTHCMIRILVSCSVQNSMGWLLNCWQKTILFFPYSIKVQMATKLWCVIDSCKDPLTKSHTILQGLNLKGFLSY